MTFSGFPFLLGFLPMFLCGLALASRLGERCVKTWLIACSVMFYGFGAPAFLPLLAVSVGTNLLLLHAIHRSTRASTITTAGVIANLLPLLWCKYLDAIPVLGLSFFTFTQIGCLLHHADGETPPPRLGDYILFTAFFPALLAGPILNTGEMLPQFSGPRTLTTDNLATGGGFFLFGLLKKTLLADPLSWTVNTGFADPAALTLFAAWQAAAAYSLQLYFDFSGYTDMAIGLAWIAGLRYPDNFDRPYTAASVIEYWQRWHMSLTRFLTTNIHAPLTLAILRWRKRTGRGINAGSQATPIGFLTMIGAPVTVTILLVSVWHGATLPFLAFGLLHAAFLLVNHAWRVNRFPPVRASAALTYLCVLIASVFFRAESLGAAGTMLTRMAGLHGIGAPNPVGLLWLAALYAIVWFAPTTRNWMLAGTRFCWRPSPGWAVVMGCAATLAVLAAGGSGEFLYFRF